MGLGLDGANLRGLAGLKPSVYTGKIWIEIPQIIVHRIAIREY
jgi:hypothetical protein